MSYSLMPIFYFDWRPSAPVVRVFTIIGSISAVITIGPWVAAIILRDYLGGSADWFFSIFDIYRIEAQGFIAGPYLFLLGVAMFSGAVVAGRAVCDLFQEQRSKPLLFVLFAMQTGGPCLALYGVAVFYSHLWDTGQAICLVVAAVNTLFVVVPLLLALRRRAVRRARSREDEARYLSYMVAFSKVMKEMKDKGASQAETDIALMDSITRSEMQQVPVEKKV